MADGDIATTLPLLREGPVLSDEHAYKFTSGMESSAESGRSDGGSLDDGEQADRDGREVVAASERRTSHR